MKNSSSEFTLEVPTDTRYVGIVDQIADAKISGWAIDLMAPRRAVTISAILDGKIIDTFTCSQARADILGAGVEGHVGGFAWSIPEQFLNGSSRKLSLELPDGKHLCFPSEGGQVGEFEFKIHTKRVEGVIDGLGRGGIEGWAAFVDARSGALFSGVTIAVRCDGVDLGQVVADVPREDVAQIKNCTRNVGFLFRPPQHLCDGRDHVWDFISVPDGARLHNSPVSLAVPPLPATSKLEAIARELGAMATKAWAAQRSIEAILPSPRFTLAEYDAWARHYHRDLRARLAEVRAMSPKPAPAALISIICPVYKPRLADFCAAVESVIAQTHSEWELLLVDDGSRSAALSACIKEFVRRDPRIRAIRNGRNGGISAATNAAVAAAKGQWIAFFDHDDLLVDVALETMMRAIGSSGVQIAFSDEDKIDDAGTFSEPHFKPGWNRRLLLSQNYVCHLLLVNRELLARAGKFDSACDGAQDHDMILRLSGLVLDDTVLHVPEILYHWRKTPSSTASSGGAKSYAIEGGVRAVQKHLDRTNVRGRARSLAGLTCYGVDWDGPSSARVRIVIPFREQVEMTGRCLAALRANTAHEAIEIVLVDNGSTSSAASSFGAEAAALPGVRTLRVDEPFNWSRLNNLAARLPGVWDHLLTLNNDVFVSSTGSGWLSAMLAEMQADASAGAVGAKLLYPDNTVQHAGVVLGVGGVADHAFKGLPCAAAGYMGRAICTHEVSAVTGACMLIRREAFEAAGGFDEEDLRVAFNDVDFCLRLRGLGWRVIWTPEAVAAHHESTSRVSDLAPERLTQFALENLAMRARWGKLLDTDPFYPRHFSRKGGLFTDLSDSFVGGEGVYR